MKIEVSSIKIEDQDYKKEKYSKENPNPNEPLKVDDGNTD